MPFRVQPIALRRSGSYAEKVRSGKLAVEDMTGGTFTVSNGD